MNLVSCRSAGWFAIQNHCALQRVTASEVLCRIEGRNSVKRTVIRLSYLFPLTAKLIWILYKVHPKCTFRRLSYTVFRARDRFEQLHIMQPTIRCETVVVARKRGGASSLERGSREGPLERNESLTRCSHSNPRGGGVALFLSFVLRSSIPPTRVLILPVGLNLLMRVARRRDRISLH